MLATYSLSHILQHLAKRIDVGTRIALGTWLELFGCHIAVCASRNLQHAEGFAVGKSEVDELHVTASVSQHYVGGLDVAMDGLLGVHIFHSVEQLVGYLACLLLSHVAAFYSRFKRLAVHIFHDYAFAQFAHRLHAYSAADVGMVELQPYLEFLKKCLMINRCVKKVRLQAFQHVALAISYGCEKTGEARPRHIALADISKATVGSRYYKIRFVVYVFHISRSGSVFIVTHNQFKLSS